jgi:hypothetical protein
MGSFFFEVENVNRHDISNNGLPTDCIYIKCFVLSESKDIFDFLY